MSLFRLVGVTGPAEIALCLQDYIQSSLLTVNTSSGRGALHTPALTAIAYATNSISQLQDASILLQARPPLAPFLFSASHSMYKQLILLVSASNTFREHLEC